MLVGFVAAVACLFWAGIHLASARRTLAAITTPDPVDVHADQAMAVIGGETP